MIKLKSLTVFFPFYNDAGTVEKALKDAYDYGNQLTEHLEVIAIHGGRSKDNTWQMILKQKKKYKDLIVIDKSDNTEGYAVIKYGFQSASKDWVFYTDGDLQYNIADIKKLIEKQSQTNADVVNGYKINRADNFIRVLLGELYKIFVRVILKPPIRDVDCDFRLIRKELLNKIRLESYNASVTAELVKKLQLAGAKFAEVPVKHYKRRYGKSTFNIWKLLIEKIIGDIKIVYNSRNENFRS